MNKVRETGLYEEKQQNLREIPKMRYVNEVFFSILKEDVRNHLHFDCAGFFIMNKIEIFNKIMLHPDSLDEQYRRKRFSFRENCILASQNFEDDLLLTADVHIDLAALDICEYFGFDPEVFKDEFKEHIVEFVCRYELMNRGAV